jgi:S-adenosylmethionine/arginine decarboxylase-like enzyme
MLWGKHLLLNARKGNDLIRCGATISKFSQTLVSAIDMKAYGKPQVIHFGSDNKAGYTLVQLIETSNITGHFCDDSRDFYLDVFSCKEYDEKTVMKLVHEVFSPVHIDSKVVWRDASHRME